jgi:hypothetical protein
VETLWAIESKVKKKNKFVYIGLKVANDLVLEILNFFSPKMVSFENKNFMLSSIPQHLKNLIFIN